MGFEVDPTRLVAVGAVVNAGRERAAVGGRGRPTAQLRWAFDPALGFPLTPFTVWRRGDRKGFEYTKARFSSTTTPEALVVWLWDGPYAEVRVRFDSAGAGTATTLNGLPHVGTTTSYRRVGGGLQQLRMAGPDTRCLTFPLGTTVHELEALTGTDAANDGRWVEHELVGLPSAGQSGGVFALDTPQGMFDAGLTDPVSAALDRYARAAPTTGWAPGTPGGRAVDAWQPADPRVLVQVFNDLMIDDLADLMTSRPASEQPLAGYEQEVVSDTGRPSTVTFNPLTAWLYGGASDSANALCTGLGTGYTGDEIGPGGGGGWGEYYEQPTYADYLLSATFLTDQGDKVERACPVLSPVPSPAPPTPAGLTAVSTGSTSPVDPDGPYSPVVTLSFDALPDTLGLGISSHALARGASSPPTALALLLEPRLGDPAAYQPIGATRNPTHPARLSLGDGTWLQDSGAVPNLLDYAVATVDVFGQWSGWGECSAATHEPAVQRVTLAGPRLDVPVDLVGTATVDLSWDWSSRTPETITVVGRLFPQSWATDPPGDLTPPTADAFAVAGAGVLATLSFTTGGVVTVAPGAGLGATVEHLSTDGLAVSSVPVQTRGVRRYRLRVTGVGVDFHAAATWGLATWAQGVEHRHPHRVGPWSTRPVVASAADPRPPVITATYEDVVLASVRDAAGLHHARLAWPPMPGAVGYHVYTCSETSFRIMHGKPDPKPSQTLRDRLLELRGWFEADPDRRPFTRVGTTPVPASGAPATQVTLPRGTRDIHLFLVIGVSSGNVESAWPTTADPDRRRRFVGFAAPTLVAPNAPRLEVATAHDPATDVHRARLRISTAAGPRVGRVELFRVRVPEAAVELDTMGPPVHSVTGTASGLTVTPTPAGDPADPTRVGQEQPIGTITGLDDVPGSWRPVYYRAVAWGIDDPTRGQYGVRSAASVLRSVVVPPSGPPVLAPLSAVLPVAGSAMVRVDTTTTVPVGDTPLGPHTVDATVLSTLQGTATTLPLLGLGPLSAVPGAAPGAGDSGVYVDPAAGGSTPLHLLVRRTAPGAVLAVRLRLTDPLGRMTEQVLDVPEAAGGALPDLTDVVVTPVAGGCVVAFTTTAPDSAPDGDYTLEVVLFPYASRRGRRDAGAQPPRRRDPRRGPRPASLTVRLADVPVVAARGGFPPAGTVIVPQRGRRAHGHSTFRVLFRREGTATLSVVAPSGERASATRAVGEALRGVDL